MSKEQVFAAYFAKESFVNTKIHDKCYCSDNVTFKFKSKILTLKLKC